MVWGLVLWKPLHVGSLTPPWTDEETETQGGCFPLGDGTRLVVAKLVCSSYYIASCHLFERELGKGGYLGWISSFCQEFGFNLFMIIEFL